MGWAEGQEPQPQAHPAGARLTLEVQVERQAEVGGLLWLPECRQWQGFGVGPAAQTGFLCLH